jgi:para-aminobenzoate synthetase component 1
MPICSVYPLPYCVDPAEYFARIQQAPGAVLLDAGRPQATRGRYDILSAWPLASFTAAADESADEFFQRLRQSLNDLGHADAPSDCALPFVGGLLGYLSYDFGRRIEQLSAHAVDDLHLADTQFGLYAWALISDHQQQCSQLVFHPKLQNTERTRLQQLFEQPVEQLNSDSFTLSGKFSADIDSAQYQHAIEKVQDYILAGDCYQVNFAQRFRANCQGAPWVAYCALRAACPTPFAGYFRLGHEAAILSLSPERFLHLSQAQVETRPIKGTRPRKTDPAEDARMANELLSSSKDRAENLMIVDLLRNDLSRNCQLGSVRVPELFALESYPNVHHLVSSVTGQLSPGRDALDLIKGSFPGGSITGAPKIRAMQIIDELEPNRRSLYCGSLLYLDVRGEMDSSIAIRSLLIKDGQVSCWGGGGIVADSNWQAEYAESITKVAILLQTLEQL